MFNFDLFIFLIVFYFHQLRKGHCFVCRRRRRQRPDPIVESGSRCGDSEAKLRPESGWFLSVQVSNCIYFLIISGQEYFLRL